MSFKKARESRKLTQQAAADMLNVKRSTVAMWETGQSLPRAELLPLIAETYECEIVDLLPKRKDEPTSKTTPPAPKAG